MFQVRSAGSTDEPRTYTVESGKHLTDTWDAASSYDVSVYGPNGFFRQLKGGQDANLDVTASYDEIVNEIDLLIRNRGTEPVKVTVFDRYTSRTRTMSFKVGQVRISQWSLARGRGWYDLTITAPSDPSFTYRYAGHLEDGTDSISDPLMGGLV